MRLHGVTPILSLLAGLTVAVGCATDPRRKYEIHGLPPSHKPADEPLIKPRSAPPKILIKPVVQLTAAGGSTSAAPFVTKWLVLGPFDFNETDFGGDHQQAAAHHAFIPDEADLDGTQPPPPGTTWKLRQFNSGSIVGMVDLDHFFNTPEHAAAYAVTWIDSPADMQARLLVGSDDYIKIWIDGQLVHTYAARRRKARPDQDEVLVNLREGQNRVVVKCVDVVYDWGFFLRLRPAETRHIVRTE